MNERYYIINQKKRKIMTFIGFDPLMYLQGYVYHTDFVIFQSTVSGINNLALAVLQKEKKEHPWGPVVEQYAVLNVAEAKNDPDYGDYFEVFFLSKDGSEKSSLIINKKLFEDRLIAIRYPEIKTIVEEGYKIEPNLVSYSQFPKSP